MALSSGRGDLWRSTALWACTGMIAVPLALVLWSDISRTGQELGFISVLLVAGGAGLVAGAVGGAVAGATSSPARSLRWAKRALLGVAGVAALHTAVITL